MLLTSVSRQNHLWNWILNPELPLVVVWPLQACVHYPLIKNKRKYFRSSLIHTNSYIQIQLTLHNHECRKEGRKEGGDWDLFWHYHPTIIPFMETAGKLEPQSQKTNWKPSVFFFFFLFTPGHFNVDRHLSNCLLSFNLSH